MFFYGNNVGMNSPYGQYNTFNGTQRGLYGTYNPAMHTPVQDTTNFKPSAPSKSKKKDSHAPEIIAGIALGIAALVGVYKGHNKISAFIKNMGERKAAYQLTHANMNKHGIWEGCKKFGKSVLGVGKSIYNVPKTLCKETYNVFKKTA